MNKILIFAILLSLCGCSFPTEPSGNSCRCIAIDAEDEDEEAGDE
jgi:hypothetical protein